MTTDKAGAIVARGITKHLAASRRPSSDLSNAVATSLPGSSEAQKRPANLSELCLFAIRLFSSEGLAKASMSPSTAGNAGKIIGKTRAVRTVYVTPANRRCSLGSANRTRSITTAASPIVLQAPHHVRGVLTSSFGSRSLHTPRQGQPATELRVRSCDYEIARFLDMIPALERGEFLQVSHTTFFFKMDKDSEFSSRMLTRFKIPTKNLSRQQEDFLACLTFDMFKNCFSESFVESWSEYMRAHVLQCTCKECGSCKGFYA
jgi:hypothetical protein